MNGRMPVWLAAVAMLLCIQQPVLAQEPDTRMQVLVIAVDQGVEVRWLHTHIQQAATMALPQLWKRLIPGHARNMIPKNVNAIRFLRKARPTEKGIDIVFDQRRVLSYLENNKIPYYVEQSTGRIKTDSHPLADGLPLVPAQVQSGLLMIERQASLPEQVLFEEDLGHDPHVVSLSLREVNGQSRQYRLSLKGSDDQWLFDWIERRGMRLTTSMEGWVVH